MEFLLEWKEDGFIVREFICSNCWSYIQDKYDGPNLVSSTWEDLRHK